MINLTGKKALVTGATGGIGESIAVELHKLGAEVTISGTREEKLKELADKLGSRVHIQTANLKDKESTKYLVVKAEEMMGGLDILICNAGITKDNLSMRMTEEDFEEVINVNLTSTFVLIKAATRGMMKRRFGRIITIGSIVGTMGNAGQANYVASKAGVAGMVKSFAAELASRGITVNNIAPGFIETAMTGKLTEDQKAKMMTNIAVGTFGKPEDIAYTSAFLASEQARYITGQTIHVNGGMLMV
ncbi:MAG TPA: 3-oxoacyl-[acyl-carrier-protein] reductase [Alphaproteobacteria bacterium]|nr:3-oxoacyl-[acyl-carrier-protein] reductase [Alphaproteobacteria bacterium]